MRWIVAAACACVAAWATGAEAELQRNLAVRGEGAAHLFGQSVDIVGDVDGDDAADFVAGAIGAAGNKGRAYLFSGVAGTALRSVEGTSIFAQFGLSVAGAGDCDGDAVSDFAVGSFFYPNDFNDPLKERGRVDVFSGADGAPIRHWEGAWQTQRLGTSLTGGEGKVLAGSQYGGDADLFVAPGSAILYDCTTGAVLHEWEGEAARNQFGFAVARAGDANGDGNLDWLVGANAYDFRGRAYLYSGVDYSEIAHFDGEESSTGYAEQVAGAGDANGDGMDDVLVAARLFGAGGQQRGRAYLYSGSDGSLIRTYTGSEDYDQLGYGLAPAGDQDGDARDDHVVGLPGLPFLGNYGEAHIYSGATGARIAQLGPEEPLQMSGDSFGASAAGGADVDGDMQPDVLVGAFNRDFAGPQRGAVYLFGACKAAGPEIAGNGADDDCDPLTFDAVEDGRRALETAIGDGAPPFNLGLVLLALLLLAGLGAG